MARSGLVKLVLAFVAGLVMALGSALILVRTHRTPPVPVAEVQQEVEQESPSPEPAPQVEPEKAHQPEVSPPKQPPLRKSDGTKPVPFRTKVTKRTQALPPVQVVQNTPPALPAAAPGYPALSQPMQEEAAPQTRQPQPHVVELAAGTNLAIRLGETISSEHNYTGDAFRGTLEEPIIRNGFIIADKGSKVLGRVVNAIEAGRMRGVSNLNVTLTEINTTDGQRIKVETNSVEKNGFKGTGTDAAKIAGGAALGAIIGALGGGGKGAAIGAGAGGAAGTGVVLATRGKPAVLPNESRLVFQLVSPVTITEKLNN